MSDGFQAALLAAELNWVDLLIALFLLILVWRGLRIGLIAGLLSLATLGGALWLAIAFHGPASEWLAGATGLPDGATSLVAFVGLLVVGRLLLGIPAAQLEAAIEMSLRYLPPLSSLNRVAGIIPEVLLGAVAIVSVLLILSTVPLSRPVAAAIQSSWTGRTVLPQVSEAVPAAQEALDALPASALPVPAPRVAEPTERIDLEIPPGIRLTVDEEAEEHLLDLVNRERAERGLRPLLLDPTIVPVARAHSRDMFERSYFAHMNPDGEEPFDRLRSGEVRFRVAGENLALAPTVERAHAGLMNSPGHRENILRPEFGRIGIGAVRGGHYGIMFTQNFAD